LDTTTAPSLLILRWYVGSYGEYALAMMSILARQGRCVALWATKRA